MDEILIYTCPSCGGLVLAKEKQKTKLCPYCGSQINLLRAKKVAAANTAFEASKLLRTIKSERGFTKN